MYVLTALPSCSTSAGHPSDEVKDFYLYVFTKLASWDDDHAGEILPISGPHEGLLALPGDVDDDGVDDDDDDEVDAFNDSGIDYMADDDVDGDGSHRLIQPWVQTAIVCAVGLFMLWLSVRYVFGTR